MTPDVPLFLAVLCAVIFWRGPLLRFLDACCHCEGFIRAEEAKEILAMMTDRRVG